MYPDWRQMTSQAESKVGWVSKSITYVIRHQTLCSFAKTAQSRINRSLWLTPSPSPLAPNRRTSSDPNIVPIVRFESTVRARDHDFAEITQNQVHRHQKPVFWCLLTWDLSANGQKSWPPAKTASSKPTTFSETQIWDPGEPLCAHWPSQTFVHTLAPRDLKFTSRGTTYFFLLPSFSYFLSNILLHSFLDTCAFSPCWTGCAFILFTFVLRLLRCAAWGSRTWPWSFGRSNR